MAGCCEDGNEPSDSTKSSDCYILKTGSAALSWSLSLPCLLQNSSSIARIIHTRNVD
jgi:hypothetical protein